MKKIALYPNNQKDLPIDPGYSSWLKSHPMTNKF